MVYKITKIRYHAIKINNINIHHVDEVQIDQTGVQNKVILSFSHAESKVRRMKIKISKEVYGDPNKYQAIFEANEPMLSHPDKIYPGQKLVIPSLA